MQIRFVKTNIQDGVSCGKPGTGNCTQDTNYKISINVLCRISGTGKGTLDTNYIINWNSLSLVR